MNWKSPGFLAKAVFVGVVVVALLEFAFVRVNDAVENAKPSPEVLVLEGFEEYQEQVDFLNESRRGDQFCKLEVKSGESRNPLGAWQQVVQAEPCFTLTEDLDNKQFSSQELESASNWYVEFLLEQVFDSSLLNNPDGFLTWLEVEAPTFFTDEVLAFVAEDPRGQFEVDGRIVYSDEMVASWGKADSNFYAFTRDGGPRILALKGGLDADFYSLEKNQVDLTGLFSIYYRVDKKIYVESLIEKENWTLVSLKEQHPELFDNSPLAVRVDARVGHTLERVEGGQWLITRWEYPNYTFRVGG
jgi:hypothetical protein